MTNYTHSPIQKRILWSSLLSYELAVTTSERKRARFTRELATSRQNKRTHFKYNSHQMIYHFWFATCYILIVNLLFSIFVLLIFFPSFLFLLQFYIALITINIIILKAKIPNLYSEAKHCHIYYRTVLRKIKRAAIEEKHSFYTQTNKQIFFILFGTFHYKRDQPTSKTTSKEQQTVNVPSFQRINFNP